MYYMNSVNIAYPIHRGVFLIGVSEEVERLSKGHEIFDVSGPTGAHIF